MRTGGFICLMEQLPWERLQIAIAAVASAQAAIDWTLAYVKEHKVFGQLERGQRVGIPEIGWWISDNDRFFLELEACVDPVFKELLKNRPYQIRPWPSVSEHGYKPNPSPLLARITWSQDDHGVDPEWLTR